MLKTPVCIVGGGPAGLMASLFLSKNGVAHSLIERNTTPVEKVCGECYDGRLSTVLNKLDSQLLPTMLQEKVIHPIKNYQYFNNAGKMLSICATKYNATERYGTYRPNFDAFLLQQALKSSYLKYYDGISVDKTVVTDTAIDIASNNLLVKANLAIIATGNQSPLAANKIKQASNYFLLAARGYYRHLDAPFTDGFFQVHLIKDPLPCFLYIVSLPDGLFTVELMILKTNAVKNQLNPETLLHDIINNHHPVKKIFKNAILVGKIKGASLPSTINNRQVFSAERQLFVGSSGGSVNPLTGWGVGHAVFQGMKAAEQCVKSLKNQNYSAEFLQSFDKSLYVALKSDWRKSRYADVTMRYLHNTTDRFIGLVAAYPFLGKKVANAIVKG